MTNETNYGWLEEKLRSEIQNSSFYKEYTMKIGLGDLSKGENNIEDTVSYARQMQ